MYKKAIELLFTEYKEQDPDWQFNACKALEHGQNAHIFLATKAMQRDQMLQRLIENV